MTQAKKIKPQTHTPGPWDLHKDLDDKPAIMAGGGAEWIAEVNGDSNPYDAANARLIAAAPELLAALKDALTMLENCPDVYSIPDEKMLAPIRAAIAKAQGVR